MSRIINGKATFSTAVKSDSKLLFWKIIEICSLINLFFSLSLRFVTDFPKILIFPFDGVSNRDIKCKKVDLPDPDGPIMATTFPVSILRFILFKIVTYTRHLVYFVYFLFLLEVFWNL